MADFENKPDVQNQKTDPAQNDGGMYKNLNISVRSLSIAIVVGIALIATLIFFGSKNGGYTVSYDSRGGSDVQSQVYQYQEELVLPQAPTREGYTFTGWYLDPEAKVPIELPVLIEDSCQYYAGWQQE